MSEYEPKAYPPESKAKLEAIIKSDGVKEAIKELDDLDNHMSKTSTPTEEMLKEWARKAIGYGNYLRKKLAKIAASEKNEEANRCLEIQIECSKNKITYSAAAAKIEASAYVAPVRMLKDILESYVVSADNLISVCRMNLYKNQEKAIEVDV